MPELVRQGKLNRLRVETSEIFALSGGILPLQFLTKDRKTRKDKRLPKLG